MNSLYKYADIYEEINMSSITDFAHRLNEWLRAADRRVASLLDCGCGTGAMIEKLRQPGMVCHGVDISEAMIEIAKSRSSKGGYVRASMLEYDTDCLYDLIICVNDVINYLQPFEWSQYFRKIKRLLNPEGLFYFDYDTYYDFANVWNGHDEISLGNAWMCYKWHEFDAVRSRGVEHQTWFIQQASGLYRRFSEDHCLYAVEDHVIEKMLKQVGLKIVGVVEPGTFQSIDLADQVIRKGIMVEHD